jgi:ATP-binding cassette subfamily F protein uup
MTILAQLKNINISYGPRTLFKNAALSINKGEKIGLLGLNGHGKSTLYKILNAELVPDSSTPPFIFDKNVNEFTLLKIPQDIQECQNLNLSVSDFYLNFYPNLLEPTLVLNKINEELSREMTEELMNSQHELMNKIEQHNGWQIQDQYLSFLESFGLHDTGQSIESLSGGEQRKILLAIGLSCPHEIVLWDEPTNHLDIETIQKFETLIKNQPKTFLITTHDRYLLNNVCGKIFSIEGSLIREFSGSYDHYLEAMEREQEELEKEITKNQNTFRREQAWMRQGIKARGTRSKKRVERFNDLNKKLQNLKGKKKKEQSWELIHSGRKTKRLMEIEQGEFCYDSKTIFKELDLAIYRGDKIGLLGPNGSGKTTLLKLIEGKLNFQKGNEKRADDLKIVRFDQNRKELNPNINLLETIGRGKEFIIMHDGKELHVRSYLKRFFFDDYQMERPVHTLSGGEKNRLQLALFLAQAADLWIFDEPTNDLDIPTIELLIDMLSNYQSALIIVSHDRAFIDDLVDQSWYLNNHNIDIFMGGYSQLQNFLETEKQVDKKSYPKNDTNDLKAKNKPSNKQKLRWQGIEKEISEVESDIQKIETQIAKFDYINDNHDKLNDLNKDLKNKQQTLEDLYEEWDQLSSIMG